MPDPDAAAAYVRVTQACGVFAVVIGCTGLAGWAFDVETLKSLFIGDITIKANAALCLVLTGAAVFLLADEGRRGLWRNIIGAGAGAAVFVIGGLTLFEHLTGWNIGIDELLSHEAPGAAATASPGRMGPPASTSFSLFGIAIVLMVLNTRRAVLASQCCALLIGLIALLPLIGYAYAIEPLYGVSKYTGIAAHTAVSIAGLAVAMLMARPRCGVMAVVCADDFGGMTARRLLAPAILIPFLLGWLWTMGENQGLFDAAFGRPALILSLIVSFTALTWWNSRTIGRLARSRERAESDRATAISVSRESDQRLRLAMDAAHLGYWEFHPDTDAAWISRELAAMLGLSPAEMQASANLWRQRVHPDDRQRVLDLVRGALERPGEYAAEYRVVWPDGTIRWLSSKGRVLRDEAGRVRLVGVDADVTQSRDTQEALRSAKEQAERASNAKDQFLAVLSHELRTPLTPVLVTAQMMEADAELTPAQREMAMTIRRNVELEARLIDDLLDLTRISRGKISLQFGNVDAHDKIRHVLSICESDIRTRQLHLKLDLAAKRYHVPADPPRLQQILWNIVKNAIKFTPPGGTISIDTRDSAEGRLQIQVSDTGIGIEPEVLARIFDAFEQGGPAITRQFGGLGLGLAIGHALAELHGGTLTARSGGRGQGSTFTLTLPLATPSPAPGSGTSGGDAPSNGHVCHILLVEDHADTAKAMARLLRSFGHHVTIAGTVASALEAVASEPFDLLISDLGLPDGSGHDLMRQIRLSHPLNGIAVSGFGMEEDLRRSKDSGFAAHLTKPVNVQELRKTIDQLKNGQVLIG